MQIHDIISCMQLVSGDRRPVSARVLGELLPAAAYRRGRPFYIDTASLSFASNQAYMEIYAQSECPPVTISLFRFSNAIVLGQGSVIIGNQSLLLDSAAEFVNHNLAPDGTRKSSDGFETLHDGTRYFLEGTSLLVKRPWYRNFGHWLIDLMPLIPLVKDSAIDVDNVIFGLVPDGSLKDLMQTTAKAFYPNAEIIFMPDEQQICCRRLLYVQPVHVPPLFKHPLSVQRTASLARELFARSDHDFGEKIYISRQKQNVRKVTNDGALTLLLKEHDFKTIYPEDHSIEEQISIFERAKVIVGVKGAALSSIVFCNPNTHVLVLSPPSFTDPFFWDLACIKNVRYSEIFCPTDTADKSDSQQNLEVPLESLKKFFNRL